MLIIIFTVLITFFILVVYSLCKAASDNSKVVSKRTIIILEGEFENYSNELFSNLEREISNPDSLIKGYIENK